MLTYTYICVYMNNTGVFEKLLLGLNEWPFIEKCIFHLQIDALKIHNFTGNDLKKIFFFTFPHKNLSTTLHFILIKWNRWFWQTIHLEPSQPTSAYTLYIHKPVNKYNCANLPLPRPNRFAESSQGHISNHFDWILTQL